MLSVKKQNFAQNDNSDLASIFHRPALSPSFHLSRRFVSAMTNWCHLLIWVQRLVNTLWLRKTVSAIGSNIAHGNGLKNIYSPRECTAERSLQVAVASCRLFQFSHRRTHARRQNCYTRKCVKRLLKIDVMTHCGRAQKDHRRRWDRELECKHGRFWWQVRYGCNNPLPTCSQTCLPLCSHQTHEWSDSKISVAPIITTDTTHLNGWTEGRTRDGWMDSSTSTFPTFWR